jgi:hypothetical protein
LEKQPTRKTSLNRQSNATPEKNKEWQLCGIVENIARTW